MIENIGVSAIPPSVFYSEANENQLENYIIIIIIKVKSGKVKQRVQYIIPIAQCIHYTV